MSEFDFRREAASMARVANMLNMHPKWGRRVHVPEPDIPLCTSDVLVMELLPVRRACMLFVFRGDAMRLGSVGEG